ncbi:hypothetical protein H5392_13965 [Tessaracoccus sp. MC1865]|uniref:hypothetical protein n=1 Tax=Tessaracoccus sp. MC1865 TaxID=2760310 RepID=UPI0016029679|nr:hypothetical protein [Tessaracoccus sp. MC1865]MBB1484963.1 hypothetical protein [Tessaracoccus sp. MC1865]QTO38690.1 hypothetical protein J7D54_06360 [Tessaracoccus sp. MC1865]
MQPRVRNALASMTILAVAIGGAGLCTPANAAETTPTPSYASAQVATAEPALNPRLTTTAADLMSALELIDQIPTSVLEAGDVATHDWVANNLVVPRASILGCTGAIAAFLASNLFAAAKILKIKKLIKSLGGVTEAVKVMWGASFSYEKMKAAGGALAGLAGELFGITAIKTQCFS